MKIWQSQKNLTQSASILTYNLVKKPRKNLLPPKTQMNTTPPQTRTWRQIRPPPLQARHKKDPHTGLCLLQIWRIDIYNEYLRRWLILQVLLILPQHITLHYKLPGCGHHWRCLSIQKHHPGILPISHVWNGLKSLPQTDNGTYLPPNGCHTNRK